MRVTNEHIMAAISCDDCCDECKHQTPCVAPIADYAADLLEVRELIKEMREELREVLVSREHGEAKEMVFITNFAEIESILERTKEYQ